MKIDEIETNGEYAYHVNYGRAGRKRLRALEVVQVVQNEGRYSERHVRHIRCQVLDWDSGEPLDDERLVLARDLEPFKAVLDRLDAEAARRRQLTANKELTVKALDRLGVPADVYTALDTSFGPIRIFLSQEGVEALARAALVTEEPRPLANG